MKDRQDDNDTTVNVNTEENGDNPTQSQAATTDAAAREETPLTAEELAALKEQAVKAQENWDRFLRLNADFDNFKKRTAKDRLEAIKFANEDLIERLLPVLDNFEAALAAGNNADAGSIESLLMGVKMILGQLKTVVTDAGLQEIDALGKQFDPVVHEALSQEHSDEVAEGHVLRQMRKGYKLRDRLVRPASVVVSGKPVSGQEFQS
jgi:molecular chaperone GrpE